MKTNFREYAARYSLGRIPDNGDLFCLDSSKVLKR
jgi:hypothetical protein